MCKKDKEEKPEDFICKITCGNGGTACLLTFTTHFTLHSFFQAVAASYPDVSSDNPVLLRFFDDYDGFRMTLTCTGYADSTFSFNLSESNVDSFCQYIIGDPINYTVKDVFIGCIRNEMTKVTGRYVSHLKEEYHVFQ